MQLTSDKKTPLAKILMEKPKDNIAPFGSQARKHILGLVSSFNADRGYKLDLDMLKSELEFMTTPSQSAIIGLLSSPGNHLAAKWAKCAEGLKAILTNASAAFKENNEQTMKTCADKMFAMSCATIDGLIDKARRDAGMKKLAKTFADFSQRVHEEAPQKAMGKLLKQGHQ